MWSKKVRESPRRFDALELCEEFFKMSSGWFDCTEPSLRTFYRGSKVCRVLFGPHNYRDYALVWVFRVLFDAFD